MACIDIRLTRWMSNRQLSANRALIDHRSVYENRCVGCLRIIRFNEVLSATSTLPYADLIPAVAPSPACEVGLRRQPLTRVNIIFGRYGTKATRFHAALPHCCRSLYMAGDSLSASLRTSTIGVTSDSSYRRIVTHSHWQRCDQTFFSTEAVFIAHRATHGVRDPEYALDRRHALFRSRNSQKGLNSNRARRRSPPHPIRSVGLHFSNPLGLCANGESGRGRGRGPSEHNTSTTSTRITLCRSARVNHGLARVSWSNAIVVEITRRSEELSAMLFRGLGTTIPILPASTIPRSVIP